MRLTGTKPSKKDIGSLRRGQVITTYGCGSIVDMPKESVVIAGTTYWDKHAEDEEYRITEENLQRLLGVEYFVTPPVKSEEYQYPQYWLPAFRFPKWLFCPKCHRLAVDKVFNFVNNPRCEKCKKPLVPSRFVVACENGHLDEFPYEWWVHKRKACTGSDRPELFIHISEKSSGLESIVIECKSCDARRSMAGSFGRDALKGYKCTRRRPWLGNDREPETCDQPMKTMQRGATNLHFPVTVSALSIPPWSERVQIELGKRWNTLRCILDDREVFIKVVESLGMPKRCACTAEELYEQAKMKRDRGEGQDEVTWRHILENEFRALRTEYSDEKGEFKTKPVDVPDFLREHIDSVILATRLREVMVLRGFKRIRPEYEMDDQKSFTSLSKEIMDWLPAIELRGEGIFLSLRTEKVRSWEARSDVINRYQIMSARSGQTISKGMGFSPRYVLLHTISHLIIRQLEMQCGYASASVRERLYCTFPEEPDALEMAGILIYTSTNDAEGSLGGLVREGTTERFDSTFRQAFEMATWCSSDPLCGQSKGQGLNSLNLAACHACTLLPETSCESRNSFLDRASLIGTLDDPNIGFFGDILKRREI